MKGNTHGLPAAGPDLVTQPLAAEFLGVWGVREVVYDDCVLVIAGLMVEGALVISSTKDGVWISSTRHLERLSVLQSPHLSIIIECFIES